MGRALQILLALFGATAILISLLLPALYVPVKRGLPSPPRLLLAPRIRPGVILQTSWMILKGARLRGEGKAAGFFEPRATRSLLSHYLLSEFSISSKAASAFPAVFSGAVSLKKTGPTGPCAIAASIR